MRALVVAIVLALSACTSEGPIPEVSEATAPSSASASAETELGAGVPSDPLPASEWSLRASAPQPLTEVAAAAFGGQLWVAGGYAADGTPVDTVQVYDPALDAWSPGPPLPEPVHHAALVSTGDRLYLLGGYIEAAGTPTDAVRVLDPAAGTWQDGPSLPAPRAAGAAAWDGQRIVYGGGVGPSGVAAEVDALQGEAWFPVGVLATAREHLAAASDGDGSVWFLGGRRGGLDTNLADVDLVSGDAVRPYTPLPTPRGGIAGFYAPGAGACAAGGEGPEGTFVAVECVGSDATTTLPDLAEGRHGIGAVTLEGTAYVLLGGPEPGLTVSDTVQALGLY
jgi:hypothetical protein